MVRFCSMRQTIQVDKVSSSGNSYRINSPSFFSDFIGKICCRINIVLCIGIVLIIRGIGIVDISAAIPQIIITIGISSGVGVTIRYKYNIYRIIIIPKNTVCGCQCFVPTSTSLNL